MAQKFTARNMVMKWATDGAGDSMCVKTVLEDPDEYQGIYWCS